MLKGFKASCSMWKSIRHMLHPRQSFNDAQSLFAPDSGRWLWNEEFQRARHTRIFNVKALEDAVATAVGAQSGTGVVQIRKLAEGGSNKVFTATVGTTRVVVKLPDPVVPPHLVTASEVATLEYLRTELNIPVPRVLAWSSKNDNPIGCEYIIMEEVQGDPVNVCWDASFKAKQKLGLVDQICAIQSRLLQYSHQLGGYGSLYFSEDANSFNFTKKLPVKSISSPTRFCLGPLAHRSFMHPEVESAGIDCGPWTSQQEYLVAAIDCSIAQVKSQQQSRRVPELVDSFFDFPYDTCSDASPEAALGLLHQYRLAAPTLLPSSSEQPDLALPVIWHKDLHLGNIFVDSEGLIKGIIDWQNTYCLPVFFQAEVPSFADFYQGRELLELPRDFSTMFKSNKKKELSQSFLQTKLQQYYLASFSEDPSGVSKILANSSWVSLRDLAVSAAGRSFTSRADVIVLRELLLRIQRHWAEIMELSGSHVTCPVSIGEDELRKHRMDGKQWNDFKDALKSGNIPADRTGWVHKEDFKKQKENLRLVIDEFLSSLKDDKHREQFQKNIKLWNLTE